MNEKEFLQQQMAAVERMREMNARSAFGSRSPHQMPPVPSFVKVNDGRSNKGSNPVGQSAHPRTPQENTAPDIIPPKNENTKTRSLNPINGGIPFLDKILTDGDATLIIGLLLLLMSENADKKLLFALVYILL